MIQRDYLIPHTTTKVTPKYYLIKKPINITDLPPVCHKVQKPLLEDLNYYIEVEAYMFVSQIDWEIS